MPRAPEAAPRRSENREGAASGTRAFRVSEPDAEGNRFLIALGTDGREYPPSSGEAGAFAREGA